MSRSDRLYTLIATLEDGALHRAADLARTLGVSERTIYRDMDTLRASGLPVTGTPGTGYRAARSITLPALPLSEAELEALHLALAIVSEAGDADLRAAAQSLTDKLDAALPTAAAPPEALATYPFAEATRGLAHLPATRAAIAGRQKLAIVAGAAQTLRPLKLEHWGRIWLLIGWSEQADGFVTLRLDQLESVTPLPELFVDEPGKRLEDR